MVQLDEARRCAGKDWGAMPRPLPSRLTEAQIAHRLYTFRFDQDELARETNPAYARRGID